MAEWNVLILCTARRGKTWKRIVRVSARTYRDAVRAAREITTLFGQVRMSAKPIRP